MLALDEIELKQTRFYQEIAEEERQEGRKEGIKEGIKEGRREESIALLTRQLQRKFGTPIELEQPLLRLSEMSLETLEDLAVAVLDFNNIEDFQNWMKKM